MSCQLGFDGYSIISIANNNDCNKFTSKQYGYNNINSNAYSDIEYTTQPIACYQILFNIEKEWIAVENGANWVINEFDFKNNLCKKCIIFTCI